MTGQPNVAVFVVCVVITTFFLLFQVSTVITRQAVRVFLLVSAIVGKRKNFIFQTLF